MATSKMKTAVIDDSRSNPKPKQDLPFMQLNLEKMPNNLTKVSLQHQCYKLVPDLLTPEDNENSSFEVMHSTPAQKPKRRQLPKIPSDKKPFGKLWQMEMNRISEQSEQLKKLERNLRWKLSIANMLLEIKTDPSTGKTLSIKMLNDDDKDCDGDANKENIFSPLQIVDTKNLHLSLDPSNTEHTFSSLDFSNTHLDDMIPPMQTTQLSSQLSRVTNTSSDSGISSNINSPSVTFNDKIEFFENKSTNSKANDDKEQTKSPDATHRALFKFCARHQDEIDLQIGDGVYVFQEFDDQWSEGLNLRTGAKGIFPSSLVIDVNYSEFMFETDSSPSNIAKFPWIDFRIQRDRFILDFLGSIEVFKAKGEEVLDESIRRVSIGAKPLSNLDMDIPFHCLLEISDIGIRMCDDLQAQSIMHKQPQVKISKHDYFFALVQITYCGYQYKDDIYYFAFITRHPSVQTRFACHVFQGVDNSTRDVAEAVGRAFHRFYNRFVQITLPMDNFHLGN